MIFQFYVSSTDQFKKEDLALALVMQYANEVAQVAHLHAVIHKVSYVFLSGNMAATDVMRRELTKSLTLKHVSYTKVSSLL